jgi:hypothetical protein
VLDDYTDRSGPLRILWPSSRQLAPKLRVFVDFLAANLVSRRRRRIRHSGRQPDKLLGRIDFHPSKIGVFAAISEALFEEQVRVGIIVEAVDLGPAAATVELACFR